jgi:nucleoside 2-deoxyribosyltransferase
VKIYIAHNYSARILLRDTVSILQKMGHQVASQWITDDAHEGVNHEAARMDLDDIDRADALLLFVDQIGDTSGKGKYIEMGYAMGTHKPVILIGKDDGCVFYHLADCGMRRIQSLEEL